MRLRRVLAVALAWSCAACAASGGDAARIDQSALIGTWSNPGGALLRFKTDHRVTGEGLNQALLGGSSCPDAATGHWSFFSAPNDAGTSVADDTLTRGDTIALSIRSAQGSCQLSALVHRDEPGLNLCLVQDPDSDCSADELLRLEAGPENRL